MSVDSSSWKIRNEQKLTCKVLGMSSLPQFEINKLKNKNIKITGKQNISYIRKEEKLCQVPCPGSNLGLHVYEASVLPTELSFRMKDFEKIMTIYIWFVVQQMYVSLTYPFNIVQHTLSHIVEHCKLDSLTTPDNIVWSTVTSCWTNNVRQFDPSHVARKGMW